MMSLRSPSVSFSSARQTAGAAFRKRAVIAGKYNYRVVGKAVVADGVEQPANAPVEFLHHIAVGARPGSICKGRGWNQGDVRRAAAAVKGLPRACATMPKIRILRTVFITSTKISSAKIHLVILFYDHKPGYELFLDRVMILYFAYSSS